MEPLAGEAVVAETLENLIRQFSDPLCFYRELIQNAIDAGSHQVDVNVSYDDDKKIAVAEVIDSGEGMDRNIIDTQLTRLFASSKEDDLTKIGKFGVGFASVFAPGPAAVVVDTSRNGENWRVLFKSTRQFERIRLDEPTEGTRVRLFIPMPRTAYKKFVKNSEKTVRYWCRHAQCAVRFAGKAINEPFDIGSPIQVRHEEAGTEIVVGLSDARAPFFGYYNQGLTLLEGRKKLVPGVTFKIKSRYLEHTLTRDNVMQDRNYDKAMKILERVVQTKLMPEMYRQLQAGAEQGLPQWSALLELARPHMAASWPIAGVDVPLLRRLQGPLCSLRQATENAARFRDFLRGLKLNQPRALLPCATEAGPATSVLEQSGVWVLDHAWVNPLAEVLDILQLPLFPASQYLAAPQPLPESDVSVDMRRLVEVARRLLLGVGVKFGQVEFHRFSYPSSPVADRVYLIRSVHGPLVPSTAHAALGEDEPPPAWPATLMGRGDLLLNVEHPLMIRLLRLQQKDVASAAYLLAKVVCLADGVHAATETKLLGGYLKERVHA